MKFHLLRLSQIAIDLFVLSLAFGLAFFLRWDWSPPADVIGRVFLIAPYVIGLEYLVLVALGVRKFSWRYIGLREIGRIFAALALASVVLLVSRLVVGALQDDFRYLRHGVVPFSVIAMNFVLAFGGIAGVRVVRRMLGERADARRPSLRPRKTELVPTLLVGAGQAGVLVAKELAQRPELGLAPVGFLDDDRLKRGTVIHGIPVLGTSHELEELATEHGARQVLITMANVPGAVVRRIRELADRAGLPAKIIPGIYEIVDGRVNLSRIRDVAIEDLLGRDPVSLDLEALDGFLGDRVVLVTGAGGSIGSELCRQVARFAPRQLVLFEQAENALFEVHRELSAAYPDLELIPCIGDVCDVERVQQTFARHRPSAVFHAAAHKHVPMMEWNPGEAVKNNVGGTKCVADAAHRFGCDAFVMISTDKAVNPTSIMGTTKRVAELYVQTLAAQSKTRFVTVRFGNVLGSNGSVVPIFREQIAKGGPITVTHPDMRRYFMTIPEACQLVLQAGSMGKGGEIFILDMGEPVKIVDLARDLIALSGLRVGEDIEIVFTGNRPGEKLFEELATDAEHADKTAHPKIFIGKLGSSDPSKTRASVEALLTLANGEGEAIRRELGALVPEYAPPAPKATATKTRERLPTPPHASPAG
ncbi:MAG: polysaccharide biosynthesis protein [Myxococcota bacterium]|nr:polysaccharide biosynthesis protein [Myxococcota bacterium]